MDCAGRGRFFPGRGSGQTSPRSVRGHPARRILAKSKRDVRFMHSFIFETGTQFSTPELALPILDPRIAFATRQLARVGRT